MRLHPGVYVDHTGEPSWLQLAWASVLLCWPAALAGHSDRLVAPRGEGDRLVLFLTWRSRAGVKRVPGWQALESHRGRGIRAQAMDRDGTLAKYNVKVLGTPIATIEATEDRKIFCDKLAEIGVVFLMVSIGRP